VDGSATQHRIFIEAIYDYATKRRKEKRRKTQQCNKNKGEVSEDRRKEATLLISTVPPKAFSCGSLSKHSGPWRHGWMDYKHFKQLLVVHK